MQYQFIHYITRCSSFFALCISLVGCQTIPEIMGQSDVIERVIVQDTFLSSQTDQDLQAIEIKLTAQKPLTESEAVLYALQNNAAFKAVLIDLKIAKADLINAGLLPNPELLYSFSATNKSYRYAIDFPLEALWLRPIKLRNMKNEADATASRLTQAGLNLIKDVRVAYAQAVLTEERLKVTAASYQLRKQIHFLSTKRLASGDINGKDVLLAKNDAAIAKRDWELAQYDITAKTESILFLLGVNSNQRHIALSPNLIPACEVEEIETLLTKSLAQRQDVLAAQFSVKAAEEKLKLSKVSWLRFFGVADATSGQVNGHTLSPSIRATLPIFNQNQGVISRSEAELEKAILNLEALKQQAVLEIRTAHIQYQQSCHDWQVMQDNLLPAVQKMIALTEDAYHEGDISYLQTLEANRQFVDTQIREVTLKAELISKWAELTRNLHSQNIGKNVGE